MINIYFYKICIFIFIDKGLQVNKNFFAKVYKYHFDVGMQIIFF